MDFCKPDLKKNSFMASSTILVTASTGNIGLPLSKSLHQKGITFTAATRNAEKAQEAFGFETETVPLDFRDPAGFGPAMDGMEVLFLCGPSATPGADKLLLPLVEEAARQGVQHVVFIASYPNVMEAIEKSGMDYTFLRGNFFMQNFEMYQTEDIRDRNQIFMPAGKGKAPFVHTRDIGEIAAEALGNPRQYAGQTIYITGPEAMDHYQAAEVFSHVLGREITYREPGDDDYRRVMKERGFSDEYIEAMIAVFGKIRKGQVAQTSDSVQHVLGRPPITLEEYVEEYRDVFS